MAQQPQPVFDDMENEAPQSILDDIGDGDMEAVQQRVLADAAVLEEWEGEHRRTPLMYAIIHDPTIALWLIQHRGQHNVDTSNRAAMTALHVAAMNGRLAVVQALVAAGASPAASDAAHHMPLILACMDKGTEVVAFLLQLPAVKTTIDAVSKHQGTALLLVVLTGRRPVVQLLLDAGADPTIPAGHDSPLNRAYSSNNHHAIAALLCHTIAEADHVRLCVALLGGRRGCAGTCIGRCWGTRCRRGHSRGLQRREGLEAQGYSVVGDGRLLSRGELNGV